MKILGSRQSLGLAALLLAASAFASRLMGLLRDKIISWQFGAGGESDMYFAAFVIPDIINYLLAGGFMSITIIPLLAKGFQTDKDKAWRFFSCVLVWLSVASVFLTGMAFIFAESFAKLIAPGFDENSLVRLAFFMRIIVPAQIFFLVGSPFTALLLLRRQFTVPSLTPLIYNGFIIVCGLCFPVFFSKITGMTGYCLGVTIGAFFGAFLLPFYVCNKDKLHLAPVFRHPWMKRFLFIALPLMLGQTIMMLDEQFLRIFGSQAGEGTVSLLNYARRISQVPVALMGQAIATASYPFLVNLLANNDIEKFNQTLNAAIRAALLLIIPAAIFMIACSTPILTIIFQGGRFGIAETLSCSPLTCIMLAATPFWIVYMTIVRGFYAFGDTITPALTGTVATILCLPAYQFIASPMGAWAIASLSAVSVSLYVIWLCLIWTRRRGKGAFEGVYSICWKMLACSLPPGLAIYFIGDLISQRFNYTIMGAFLVLALSIPIFSLGLWPMARFLMPEFLRTISQRFFRTKG